MTDQTPFFYFDIDSQRVLGPWATLALAKEAAEADVRAGYDSDEDAEGLFWGDWESGVESLGEEREAFAVVGTKVQLLSHLRDTLCLPVSCLPTTFPGE